MKQNIKVAKQLVKLAKNIIAEQEQKKQENVIKKVYREIKNILKNQSLFKHKVMEKIEKIMTDLIEKMQSKKFITEQEAKILKMKLKGKNASIKIAGKKSFVFALILTLFNLFNPLLSFCQNVSSSQEQDIFKLLKSDIYCMTLSVDDIKNKDNKDIEDVYSLQQKKNTDIVSIAIDYKCNDEIFSYLFQLRVKSGTKEIITPQNMSKSDFNKIKMIIAIFDKDNELGLRDQVNNTIKEFAKINEKSLESFTNFVLKIEKDVENNDSASLSGYIDLKSKN